MHDWSDNELDGMSREAADNYGPGRGMPDWDELQKQLDKELPVRKEDNRRKFFFLIFLCLLLTGVTGYLLISQNSGTPNPNNPTITNNTPDSKKGKETDVSSEVDSKKNKAFDQKESTKIESAQPLNTSDKLSVPSAEGNKKSQQKLSLSAAPENKPSFSSTGNKKNSGNKKAISKNAGSEDLSITVETSGIKSNNISENKTVPPKGETAIGTAAAVTEVENVVTPETSDVTKPEAEKTADQNAKAKDTLAVNASVKKAPTVKSPPKGSGIELSLLAGIDASSVKFKYNDNAGVNAGLLIGYRFNKKWSVGTGLIYTKKNYTAAGSDFNPPKNYWTSAVKLDMVGGSCYMWEVPVYATYRFNSNRKSGWFVSMGLSTYFMTKENYTYYYKYTNGNPATRHWENGDPANYWFSILGISGGWEKNIGRGLSLGVAPYAKIPLQGVGFGDMSLSSYGLNLLFTYRKATGRK